MTSYNGERFIREQLDSILQQTYPNIEVIVVDDCSTDGTVAIVEPYIEKYPVIKLVRNEINLGYIRNFEKGMLLAAGDYIALSDQDDIWLKDKLTILMASIGSNEIIYSNSELVDENGNSLHRKMSDIRNQIGYSDCLMYAIGAWAPGHAMLFKKELVQRCVPFPSIVTHDFWLGFVATCKGPIKYLDTPLVLYRQHITNAIGAVKVANAVKLKKEKRTREQKLQLIRNRMELLYRKCPDETVAQKKCTRISIPAIKVSHCSITGYGCVLFLNTGIKYWHIRRNRPL